MDEFRQRLKAAGWHIGRSSMDPWNVADWYAWRDVKGEARECEHNQKRLAVFIWPYDMTEDVTRPITSATMEVCGEYGGDWYKVSAYGLQIDGLTERLDQIEAKLVRAWNALGDA